MAERDTFSACECSEIVDSLAEFFDPEKRFTIAINIINGFEEKYPSDRRVARHFVQFVEDLQKTVAIDEVSNMDMEIIKSFSMREFTNAAAKMRDFYGKSSKDQPSVRVLESAWALKVVRFEEAERIATERKAQQRRYAA